MFEMHAYVKCKRDLKKILFNTNSSTTHESLQKRYLKKYNKLCIITITLV